MASPPFSIAETTPQDSAVVLNYPLAERTFRDVVESWLNIMSDPTTGLVKLSGIAPVAAIPIGAEIDFAGASAPTGWLLEFGQTVNRTTYAALFAVIGTTYGAGDGVTTFGIPDKRGRVTAGLDNMGGTSANRLTTPINGDTLGAAGGVEAHTLTAAQMPGHTHVASGTTAAGGSHTHTLSSTEVGRDLGVGTGSSAFNAGTHDMQGVVTMTTAPTHSHTFSDTTSTAGSGGSHPNVQPTSISNKIIYAGV